MPEEIAKNFIQEECRKDEKIIGAIYYGSQCYNTAKENSDIDILFISQDKFNYKGLAKRKGYNVEYLIKPYIDIERGVFEDFKEQSSFLHSVFENGQVIYDKENKIQKMKKYLQMRSKVSYPTYQVSKQDKEKMIHAYQRLYELKGNPFLIESYNLLNQLRILYQKKYGCTKLSIAKIYEFYQNPSYAEKYYCSILPPEEFRKLFLSAIHETKEKEQKKHLLKMAEWLSIYPNEDFQSIELPVFQTNYYQTPPYTKLIEQKIVLMQKYEKTKYALEEERPDAYFLYAITLEQLRKFYEIQCGILTSSLVDVLFSYQKEENAFICKIDPEFKKIYLQGLFATTKEEKMKSLKQIYQFVTKDLPISQEYRIRLPKKEE